MVSRTRSFMYTITSRSTHAVIDSFVLTRAYTYNTTHHTNRYNRRLLLLVAAALTLLLLLLLRVAVMVIAVVY
jgi:putative flippase GtrA